MSELRYEYDLALCTHRFYKGKRLVHEITDEQIQATFDAFAEGCKAFVAAMEEGVKAVTDLSRAFGLDTRPLEARDFVSKSARAAHEEFLTESRYVKSENWGIGMQAIQDRI